LEEAIYVCKKKEEKEKEKKKQVMLGIIVR